MDLIAKKKRKYDMLSAKKIKDIDIVRNTNI